MSERLTFVSDTMAETFSVDPTRRVISGVVVPWGAIAQPNPNGPRWRFARGSLHWAATERVKLNMDHDRASRAVVAKAIRLHNTEDGLEASFKVGRGPEGDDALTRAEDGLADGFSIEVDFDDADAWEPDPTDKTVNLVRHARLSGVALTAYPSFDDARVAHVAAMRVEEPQMTENYEPITPTEESDPAKTGQDFEQHLTKLSEKLASSQTEALEHFGTSLGDTITAGFRSALENLGDPQGPEHVREARFATLNEPPIYLFDGSGHSIVRDAWAAARDHDDDALERIRKFRRQSDDMSKVVHQSVSFAPQSTSTASQVIPPGYRPDLYVADLFRERPLVGLASQGTIQNATPFTIPVFTSVTTGSATHVEGTNPSDGSLAFGTKTVSPTAISGRLVLTRELVDSANPAIDQIAFAEMRESYARQTEAVVYTLLNGTSGAGGVITAGFVPSGAQASTTAGGTDNQTLVKHLRDRTASYFFARFAGITGAAMGPAATSRLVTAVDTTQRPLFPYIGAVNAQGTANAADGTYNVDGVGFTPAWAMTGTAAGDSQIFLLNRRDLWVWESPLLTFRFEEKQGPANIELNIFGYFATHLLRPVGLSGIRIT
jgi:HK97 family phage prohead protease